MCYTEKQLEHKTNILTNKYKIKKEKNMVFMTYPEESNYDSSVCAKNIKVKLGHGALFAKDMKY